MTVTNCQLIHCELQNRSHFSSLCLSRNLSISYELSNLLTKWLFIIFTHKLFTTVRLVLIFSLSFLILVIWFFFLFHSAGPDNSLLFLKTLENSTFGLVKFLNFFNDLLHYCINLNLLCIWLDSFLVSLF